MWAMVRFPRPQSVFAGNHGDALAFQADSLGSIPSTRSRVAWVHRQEDRYAVDYRLEVAGSRLTRTNEQQVGALQLFMPLQLDRCGGV